MWTASLGVLEPQLHLLVNGPLNPPQPGVPSEIQTQDGGQGHPIFSAPGGNKPLSPGSSSVIFIKKKKMYKREQFKAYQKCGVPGGGPASAGSLHLEVYPAAPSYCVPLGHSGCSEAYCGPTLSPQADLCPHSLG